MASSDPVIAVDVGGTFTDCVAFHAGRISVVKLPTTSDQSEGVVEGSRRLVGSPASALLHGSTVATNALLERRGAETVLITDAGFEDVLEIGRQDRPSLYDSFADRPEPLVARSDRLGFTGDAAALASRVAARRPESVAVSMAYSFSDPSPELAVAVELEQLAVPVSLSHRVAPEFREFERTSTTVLNAYLWPRVATYLRQLGTRVGEVAERLQVMRSSGGLMDVEEAAGMAAALLLSGPAGGVVAAAHMGEAHGYERVIAFDMGGTSTDVCRIEGGRPEIGYERFIEGYVCRMPSVAVHTVGAGGGSLAWTDPGGSLRVGPQSAGAVPGPAAYARGGTGATVTDAHVAMGRIDPAAPLGGVLTIDPEAAHRALAAAGETLGLSARQTAAGIVEVVEAHMERAIRAVSVEQGADPRRATLVAFGGAGGLHATGLARRLEMDRVAVPPFAGVLSAVGLLMAPPRIDAARSVLLQDETGFTTAVQSVTEDARRRFKESNGHEPVRVASSADLRYRGQSHEVNVEVAPGDGFDVVAARFHETHAHVNGFSRPAQAVEIVTVRAVAEGSALLGWDDLPTLVEGPPPEGRRRTVVVGGREVDAGVWWRPSLPAGMTIEGPAVVEDDVGTLLLRGGDRGRVLTDGTIEVSWR